MKQEFKYFKYLLDIIESEVNYYESGDRIFVHGWIPSDFSDDRIKPLDNWREAFNYQWFDAATINGMNAAKKGCIIEGKTIFCGHWHTSYGHVRRQKPGLKEEEYKNLEFVDVNNFGVYEDEGIIAMDSCTIFTKRVNVYVFEE